MGSDGGAWAMDPATNYDTYFVPQGICADLIATLEGFTREDVDALRRRARSSAPPRRGPSGYFKNVRRPGGGPERPRHPRPRRAHAPGHHGGLARPAQAVLRAPWARWAASTRWRCRSTTAVERIDHVHTPGNSSGIVDGAALVLVGSEQVGKDARASRPRARIVAAATSGADPTIMLTGPLPATPQGAGARPA